MSNEMNAETIARAYGAIEAGTDYVSLDRIAEMVDLTGEQIGEAAKYLEMSGAFQLMPYPGSERDKMLGVRIGPELYHCIARNA